MGSLRGACPVPPAEAVTVGPQEAHLQGRCQLEAARWPGLLLLGTSPFHTQPLGPRRLLCSLSPQRPQHTMSCLSPGCVPVQL